MPTSYGFSAGYGSGPGDTIYTRALLIPLDGDANVIVWQVNPKAIIRDKKIKWNHLKVAGREQPFQQYGCGEPEILIMPFTVARSNNSPDYVKWTQEEFLKFTKPTAGGTVKRPPLCQLIVGGYIDMMCVVKDFKAQTEEFFSPMDLYPTSCECVLSVEKYMDQE